MNLFPQNPRMHLNCFGFCFKEKKKWVVRKGSVNELGSVGK